MGFDVEKNTLSHRLCQADISEVEAHNILATSDDPWSQVKLMARHEICYDRNRISQGCYCCDPHFGLDLALPTCCRQIYHDSHSLVYSANTWSFTLPLKYHAFSVDRNSALVRAQSFSLHRLHLDIMVDHWNEEKFWNHSFRYIAREFRCLRCFHLDVEQHPLDIDTLMRWHFQTPADCTFLKDLPLLRDLKLRTVRVTVSDDHLMRLVDRKRLTEPASQYRWSLVQQQEWAAYVTRVLLRQEDWENSILSKEEEARLKSASDTCSPKDAILDFLRRKCLSISRWRTDVAATVWPILANAPR